MNNESTIVYSLDGKTKKKRIINKLITFYYSRVFIHCRSSC